MLEYFQIYPFSISMSHSRSKSKDRVIRLGLKSPRNRKKLTQQNTPTNQLSHSFHLDDEKSNILAHSHKENEQSFHTNTERISMEKSNPSTYQQQNKLPLKKSPLPKQMQKNQVSKVIIYRQPSPQRKIVISEKSQPLQNNSSYVTNQNNIDYDLHRKNKILQQRIVQLHQEKQQTILRLHNENKRLNMDNVYLKQKMGELSSQFQYFKREEVPKEKKVAHPSSTKIKSHNSLKNDVYVEKEEDNNETSIMKKNSQSPKVVQNSQRSSKQNSAKKKKLQEVVVEDVDKEELKKSLIQKQQKIKEMEILNEELMENVKKYEGLNGEWENKINLLENSEKELKEENQNWKKVLKEKQENQQKIAKQNQFLGEEKQKMLEKITQLEEQLSSAKNLHQQSKNKLTKQYEEQIQKLNQSITSLKQQTQTKLTQYQNQKQLLIQEKSLFQQQTQRANQQLTQVNEVLETNRSDKEALSKRTEELQSELNELKKMQTSKNIQTNGNAVVGECVKCRELLKTFMKLNSKTYQK